MVDELDVLLGLKEKPIPIDKGRKQRWHRVVGCVLLLSFLGITYMVCLQNTIAHEAVHSQIQKYYGCQNTSVNINYFDLSGSAACNDVDRSRTEAEWALHSQNEIVGYNVNTIVMTMFLMAGFVSLTIWLIGGDKK